MQDKIKALQNKVLVSYNDANNSLLNLQSKTVLDLFSVGEINEKAEQIINLISSQLNEHIESFTNKENK